ncbi:MAG TPA: glutamyl-tRNA reductase [Ktedonobacterales bacterium]|nr:glutamyl-tRNA reductase [Ktedonobacterales bacterium]
MIGIIGLDYRLSNAEQRGRLSFGGERLLAALHALTESGAMREAAILSTCNRTEVYYAAADGAAASRAVNRLFEEAFARGPSAIITSVSQSDDDAPPEPVIPLPAEIADGLYEYAEAAAAEHLFRVAAGLRSMVVGEAQILGQVKDALMAAESAHTVGDELRSIFTSAIRVGKRARAETEIGRADLSVAALAVRVASESLGGLAGKSALVIGAGRTSQLCAQLLRQGGIDRLALANRSASAARDLAEQVGGDPIPLADVERAIQDISLIISATAAPHTILHGSTVAGGMAGRRAPLVVVDLAVPPDVSEDVGLLPSVSLYTLDSLRALDSEVDLAMGLPREQELRLVETMIADGVRDLLRTRAMKLAVPTIAGLRRHVDHSEEAERARALAQLTHLSDADRAVIERFGQRLVDKMFHHLVSRIRSLAEYDEVPLDVTMRVLGQLFSDPDEQRGDKQRDERQDEPARNRSAAHSDVS